MSFTYEKIESREILESETYNMGGRLYGRIPIVWVFTIYRVVGELGPRKGDQYVVRVSRKPSDDYPDQYTTYGPYKTLRRARSGAGRTATVYRGTMADYDWVAGK